MATFYKCINNGVIALVRGEVYEQMERWKEFIAQMPADTPPQFYPPCPGPTFTFVPNGRFAKTSARSFVTGDFDLLDKLIKGHSVHERQFYVPFSNHTELNEDENGSEHQYRVTVAEVVEAFELFSEPARFRTSSI